MTTGMKWGGGGKAPPKLCVASSDLLKGDATLHDARPPAAYVCRVHMRCGVVCGRSAGPVCAPRGDGLGNRMGLLGAGAECVLR